MKKWILGVLLIGAAVPVLAEYVPGYMKKDGTYVQGYFKSDANSTKQDNYSTKGNVNPYTGQKGTKSDELDEVKSPNYSTDYNKPKKKHSY